MDSSVQISSTTNLSWRVRLHDLMPFRIRDILLVSSAYDAFILEEDGPLGERLFSRYSEMNLSWSPRITHVNNGLKALDLLTKRMFDLVIAMPRLEDTNVSTLARMVKRYDPNLPVVVLSFSEAEIENYPGGIDTSVIERCFMWTGDTRIIITIAKLIEDRVNLKHDTQLVGMPVIMVVEDSVRYYSMFLAELYSELMVQSQSLVAEGVNNLHKLLRMRTRPKVIHASTLEEALKSYETSKKHIFAVISDIRFEINGQIRRDAGFRFIETIRQDNPELPVLMQSRDRDTKERANALGVRWVDKGSSNLLREIREFVSETLGFGDFVFRMPDRTEVGRARDMFELENILLKVPIESFRFHAIRNHFSVWLTARGMYDIVTEVRKVNVLKDYPTVEEARVHLVEQLQQKRAKEQEGLIIDYTKRSGIVDSMFIRLGKGSIGGKARGIAFANALLVREKLFDRFEDLRIAIPRTVVIGTEEFERFVESNGINALLDSAPSDNQILQRFLEGSFSFELMRDLREVWHGFKGPIAVRSSGLLEDLQFQPFSGVYATYMLPNNHSDLELRFQELIQAIKAVYASTYSENARSYIGGTPFRPEDEKMGVIIQEVVGQAHHNRFYPHFSGVALSYNYYPIAGQSADDGTALVALGLGQMVVMGGDVLRFCPPTPNVLPQYSKAYDYVRLSQKQFYALDVSQTQIDYMAGPDASLSLYELGDAEADGTLASVGSVYSATDDAIRDNLRVSGVRVVSFNNILKWHSIPLSQALMDLLRTYKQGMGCAVEIEFAVDMGEVSKKEQNASQNAKTKPTLYVLQIRPMATQFTQQHIELGAFRPEQLLCYTTRALGHGIYNMIRNVIYVKRDALQHQSTNQIAVQVGKLTQCLGDKRIPYMLVGPGRWGTSDPRLGIPVEWKQIASARIIAETKLKDRVVEPSQGTHFFQNITSLGIGYLTLAQTKRPLKQKANFIDMDWLDAQPAKQETIGVRHVSFEEAVPIYLEGHRGTAIILKPGECLNDI